MNIKEKCIYLEEVTHKYHTFIKKKKKYIGVYKINAFNSINSGNLKVWKKPSFKADIYEKSLMKEHEDWKIQLAKDPWYGNDSYENKLKDIHLNFGYVYNIINERKDILYSFSNSNIFAWKKTTCSDKVIWIKICQDYDLWMPTK